MLVPLMLVAGINPVECTDSRAATFCRLSMDYVASAHACIVRQHSCTQRNAHSIPGMRAAIRVCKNLMSRFMLPFVQRPLNKALQFSSPQI